ncbi:uncharacterized protein LOC119661603 [Hermetia illucens]|uniref:uncharacterized protein LOC119661603 n=1 Tax=Hermetia illucens TaxID=343691 RepID=UPI0018CC08DA|nr:uncharacterized protein LOC119661603 [Hermetia illucens]
MRTQADHPENSAPGNLLVCPLEEDLDIGPSTGGGGGIGSGRIIKGLQSKYYNLFYRKKTLIRTDLQHVPHDFLWNLVPGTWSGKNTYISSAFRVPDRSVSPEKLHHLTTITAKKANPLIDYDASTKHTFWNKSEVIEIANRQAR